MAYERLTKNTPEISLLKVCRKTLKNAKIFLLQAKLKESLPKETGVLLRPDPHPTPNLTTKGGPSMSGTSQWWALAPIIVLGLIGLIIDYHSDQRRANRYKNKR